MGIVGSDRFERCVRKLMESEHILEAVVGQNLRLARDLGGAAATTPAHFQSAILKLTSQRIVRIGNF